MWFETLPEKCPPSEATVPDNKKYYRLVSNNPPIDTDFISRRQEGFTGTFKNVSECVMRAISIWESSDKCSNLKKLPLHKEKVVVELQLSINDGVILKTSGPHHYSWWRSHAFNLSSANVIEENA